MMASLDTNHQHVDSSKELESDVMCSAGAADSSTKLGDNGSGEKDSRPHKCAVCGKGFKQLHQLRWHSNTVHIPEKRQSCSVCGRGFRDIYNLNRHMKQHRKPFQCSTCKEGFASEEQLEKHYQSKTHQRLQENPNICPTCNKGFNKADTLKFHMEGHTLELTYVCPICNKKFDSSTCRSLLQKHILHHRWKADKCFKCNVCEKAFWKSDKLRIHMRSHNGHRPYSCKTCPKSFTQAGSLQLHEKRHTGVRPHVCTTCNKGFYRKHDLNNHINRHSSVKPYRCVACCKTFSSKETLKQHSKVHEGTESPLKCNGTATLNKHRETHNQIQAKSNEHNKMGAKEVEAQAEINSNQLSDQGMRPSQIVRDERMNGPSFLSHHQVSDVDRHATSQGVARPVPFMQQISTVYSPYASLPGNIQSPLVDHSLYRFRGYGDFNAVAGPGTGNALQDLNLETSYIQNSHITCSSSVGVPIPCQNEFLKTPDAIYPQTNNIQQSVYQPSTIHYSGFQPPHCMQPVPNMLRSDIFQILNPQQQTDLIQPPYDTNAACFGDSVANPTTQQISISNEQPRVNSETALFYSDSALPNPPDSPNVYQTLATVSHNSQRHTVEQSTDGCLTDNGISLKSSDLQDNPSAFEIYIESQDNIGEVATSQGDITVMVETGGYSCYSSGGSTTQPSNFPISQTSVCQSNILIAADSVNRSFSTSNSDGNSGFQQPLVESSLFQDTRNIQNNSDSENSPRIPPVDPVDSDHESTSELVTESLNSNVNENHTKHSKKKGVQASKKKRIDNARNRSDIGLKLYICNICNRNFRDNYNLKRHFAKHIKDQPYCCDHCDERFYLQSQLDGHLKSPAHKQKIRKPHVCLTCGKGFTEECKLRSHVVLHALEKSFTCPMCGKTFDEDVPRSKLQYHLKYHQRTENKRFICDICQKTFCGSDKLRIHKRIHTGVKPFVCQICQRAFTQEGSLKLHKRIHSGDKPHSCPICSRRFARTSYLRGHLRSHEGIRNHKCETCGKGFTSSANLYKHQRIHTGQKPHCCPVCGRGFTESGSMTRHLRIHTGQKPYKCEVCGLSFAQSTTLNKHKLQIHNKK